MKAKSLLVPALMALSLSSCVTWGKYEQLEATLNQQKKEHAITRQELLDLKDEYAALQRQYQQHHSRHSQPNHELFRRSGNRRFMQR